MKREESTGPRTDPLRNATTDLKGAIFVILKSHASTPVRKVRLSPTSKARRKASQNEFVEKSGVPDRTESSGEVNCSKDYPRSPAWAC